MSTGRRESRQPDENAVDVGVGSRISRVRDLGWAPQQDEGAATTLLQASRFPPPLPPGQVFPSSRVQYLT